MKAQRVTGGLERREKVDCQACGKVKELGVRCELCGWPLVEVMPTPAGRFRVTLPLGPSTNDRMIPVKRGRYVNMILAPVARDYIQTVAAELSAILERAAQSHGFKPLAYWGPVKVWMVLPRITCDGHNYEKCLYDALELGGFFVNDRYAVPELRGLYYFKDPIVAVEA